MADSKLQRVNIFLASSPIYSSIKNPINLLFDEILENLLLTNEKQTFEPDFIIWSSRLKEFLSLYSYSFTKTNHLKLIHFYLSKLSIENLNYIYVQICFDSIHELLRFLLIKKTNDLMVSSFLF